MVLEHVSRDCIEADQVVEAAFQPASEAESTETRILRRILRREVEDLLGTHSQGEAPDLEDSSKDLELIAAKLEAEMDNDEARTQELRELVGLLKDRWSLESESPAHKSLNPQLATLAVALFGVVGGLANGISGAIVGAAAVPLFLKLVEAGRDEFCRHKHALK